LEHVGGGGTCGFGHVQDGGGKSTTACADACNPSIGKLLGGGEGNSQSPSIIVLTSKRWDGGKAGRGTGVELKIKKGDKLACHGPLVKGESMPSFRNVRIGEPAERTNQDCEKEGPPIIEESCILSTEKLKK